MLDDGLKVTVGALLVHAIATVVVTEPEPVIPLWFVLSAALTVVVSVAALAAPAVAVTVRVAVQVPPGARLLHVAGEIVEGTTKLAVAVSATERVNVELLQVALSVFFTVAA